MGGIDLHAHTTFSDGTFTPSEELVKLALERDLSVLAVTDHDTTGGLPEAAVAAEGTGLEIVPGVEFSAEYRGASLHVLAYWIDPEDSEFQAELTRLRDSRLRRAELMVERLQELGYPISFERVREIAAGAPIIRPHIAQAMVEAGIVPTEKAAFDRFIADGGPAHVPKHALHPLDAVDLIRRAGGACVLAHPGMWAGDRSVPDDLIDAMAGRGMAGLEVDHPDHTDEQRERYREMAERLGLVVTGGSDCHGTR
ncbi:MAG: PHP domain-containing protein, partial [Actinobacteria bacterium]|nr:PHP domain-containing protein [Actinomycetota bacterium]